MGELDTRLDGLSKRQRAAVCCVAVEHVLDIYKRASFGLVTNGEAAQVMSVATGEDLLEAGLAYAWLAVESGTLPSDAEVQAIVACEDFWGDGPEDREAEEHDVLGAFHFLMQSFRDPTPHASAKAINFCKYAIGDLAQSKDVDDEKDQLKADEIAWQMRVLDLAESLDERDLERDRFSTLLAEQFPWRRLLG